jgi:iron complex outermembrane receptor protein
MKRKIGMATSALLALSVVLAQAPQASAEATLSLADLFDLKVESASKQAEPLSEVPVPITVITSEMIRASGVRTLHEALNTFVPGYTDVEDRNELMNAPRGIYATSPQKVLVMINGHRLNSRSYLAAAPDESIALHNVDRIEILRGPGSSLYGNVALGGVINILLKKGADVKGTSVDLGMGNFGQTKARFLTGQGGEGWDSLTWGQAYTAYGEVVALDGNETHNTGRTGNIVVGGVRDPMVHDVGTRFRLGNWTYFLASRRSRFVEPYGGASPSSGAYDYGAIRRFMEVGPGLGLSHQHMGAEYNTKLGNWDFTFNPYLHFSRIEGILATGNATGTGTGGGVITWQDRAAGFVVQGLRDYETGWGKGSLLVGLQSDMMELMDSFRIGISNGEFTTTTGSDTSAAPLLARGSEGAHSAFVQAKHRLNDQMILNLGGRYDYKQRKTGDPTQNLSPRLAFIYLPGGSLEYKLSYSESFVDGPYWYRYTTLPAFAGSSDLNPELLKATQFMTSFTSEDKSLRSNVVLYHQVATNAIANNPDSAATQKFINAGRAESAGLESETSFVGENYMVLFNFQYYKALSDKLYSLVDDVFAHVPQVTANLNYTHYFMNKKLLANAGLNYIGSQKYVVGTDTKSVDAATLINLGVRYEDVLGSGIDFDARVYNAADTIRFQGGQNKTILPARQTGRWYLATLGYNF